MSAHSAAFDSHAAPAIVDQFGTADSVSYQSADPGDDPIVVAGIIGPEATERRRDSKGAIEVVRVRSIMLRDSSLARTTVKLNGTVAVDGRTYAITHVSDVVGETYEVELERMTKGEVTRDGYRKR